MFGTKNNQIRPLLELKIPELFQFWNQKIWSHSTFGTKFEGVVSFLQLKNPEVILISFQQK